MGNRAYSEEQIAEFLEVAQEVGITPAMRKLGYPNSWATANRWAEARGVTVSVDTLKQHATQTHQWYSIQDKILICQETLRRIYEKVTVEDLTPDDLKKIADAIKRVMETMNLLEGKATNITKESSDDDAFKALLAEFNNSNSDVA